MTDFKQLLADHHLTIREFSKRFSIPVRTAENWSTGARSMPDYLLPLLRFGLENDYPPKQAYFCEECGARFSAHPSLADLCPRCGCACVYPDTDEGRRQSIADMTDYENELAEPEETDHE